MLQTEQSMLLANQFQNFDVASHSCRLLVALNERQRIITWCGRVAAEEILLMHPASLRMSAKLNAML